MKYTSTLKKRKYFDFALRLHLVRNDYGCFPFAPSDRADKYFESKNDGFKKGNHLKMVASDLEKIILMFDLNIKARSG